MGLAMAYGIIKNHGGEIEVDSDLGAGTVFSIYLPLSDREPVRTAPAPPRPTQSGAGLVLVVDDEDPVRRLIIRALERGGFKTLEAVDGQVAVELYGARHDEIDLVILDMVMPRLEGQECFKRLKQIDPEVRVIVASGYALDGRAQEILDGGALDFFQKPFDMNQLVERIQQILAPGAEHQR